MPLRLAVLSTLIALPAAADQIVPRDGTWTVQGVDSRMSETCPPMLRPMADQIAANMGAQHSYDVTWDGVFDPNRAAGLDPDGAGLVWVEGPDGSWTANLAGPDNDYVVATMRAINAEKIENRVEMDMAQMMEAEGGALPGMAGCTLSMIFEMDHTG